MAASKLLIFFFIFWVNNVGSVLLELRKRCVPTAQVTNKCYSCVCTTEGVYNCRNKTCQQSTSQIKSTMKDCEPDITYREETMICTCHSNGHWRSIYCRQKFGSLRPKERTIKTLRTNIVCTKNETYLIDCNICQCHQGSIDLNDCTKRKCFKGHKNDSCGFGDVLRTKNELCTCSDNNYYTDRSCINIDDKFAQIINRRGLDKLLNKIVDKTCEPNTQIQIDCNSCICNDGGEFMCTNMICIADEPKDELFSRKEILRELRINKEKFKSLPNFEPNKKCTPGQEFRKLCNTCVCDGSGELYCTTMICLEANSVEIKEGDPCSPGQVYKIDCNTCRCGSDNNLLCTKMLCLTKDEIAQFKKKSRRKGSEDEYPQLPDGDCVPGTIYKKDFCKKCFCEDNKKAVCNMKPCSLSSTRPVKNPEDVRHAFSDDELDNIPVLPNSAAECVPGKTYKVYCNPCLCLANGNLLCSDKLCLSYDEMNKAEAFKMSGVLCNKQKGSVSECIKCSCEEDLIRCVAEPGCKTIVERRLGNSTLVKPKLILDMNKEECLSNMIYKNDCNKCFCGTDRLLRCTQKKCIDHALAVKLKKYRLLQND